MRLTLKVGPGVISANAVTSSSTRSSLTTHTATDALTQKDAECQSRTCRNIEINFNLMPPEPPADTLESWHSDTSSLVAAIESEENKLVSRHFPHLQEQFYLSINAQKGELEDLICNLLQVPSCRIIPSRLWRSGSFNVAVLVRLPFGKNVYLRLPFLHRIGEHTFPGNVEEKICTEVATYLWLQEHCPDVPIPSLYAFGLPDGSIVRPTRFTIQHAYADLFVSSHAPKIPLGDGG